MECEPFEQAPIASYPSAASWSADAPDIVARMLERWQLTLVSAFVGGVAASVLSVTTDAGDPAVLKVAFPHPEGMWEAVGLSSFPAGTAPRVLRQDAWTWSMLLEPVVPGTPLASGELSPTEAIEIGGSLLARLHEGVVPAGIPSLRNAMGDYSNAAMERLPHQRARLHELGVAGLVTDATEELERLARDDAPVVLLHGDFNPGNILRDETNGQGGWRAIDPKPLSGDPAFDLWPIVTQLGAPFESPDPAARLRDQLERAADAAGVDAARAACWAFARTGLNVSWYLADGDEHQAEVESEALRVWARVAGQ
jgi:streptomycin 6-kinase